MITFFITLAIITLYTILFVVFGSWFKQYLLSNSTDKFHQTLHLGSSFFIGLTFFLCTWIITGHLSTNAKFGLVVATSLFIIASAISLFETTRYQCSRSTIITSVLVTSLVIGLSVFKALSPMPEYFVSQPDLVNPFAGFGSVAHSFRAGNIAEFIVSENRFPVIGQHTGQSIIAAIPLFFGVDSIQLSLTIWMGIVISFVLFTTYGLARIFLEKYYALYPTLFVMLGNSVLSPLYSSVTDTESALLLSSNTDSLYGIMTFLLLAFVLFFATKTTFHKSLLLFVFSLSFIWNITSGHMIILMVLLAVFFLVYTRYSVIKNLSQVALSFSLGTLLGVVALGGMLTPSGLIQDGSIPGVMSLKQANADPIIIRFPRTGESGSLTRQRLSAMLPSPSETTVRPTNPTTIAAEEVPKTSERVKENSFLFGLAKIVRSIQVVFFPLLGLLLFYVLLKRKIYPASEFTVFWSSSVFLFSIGWTASTFFTVYGYYWELSKFFYVGIYLALFLLGISVAMLIRLYTTWRPLLAALTIFIVLGPTLELFGVRILGNVYLPPAEHPNFTEQAETVNLRPLTLKERFLFLINSNGVYGENHE